MQKADCWRESVERWKIFQNIADWKFEGKNKQISNVYYIKDGSADDFADEHASISIMSSQVLRLYKDMYFVEI